MDKERAPCNLRRVAYTRIPLSQAAESRSPAGACAQAAMFMPSQRGAALPHSLGRQYGGGPRNNRHRLLVVVDPSTTGIVIVQEQKRTLTTSFDFSDVTLAFDDRIKDWLNV